MPAVLQLYYSCSRRAIRSLWKAISNFRSGGELQGLCWRRSFVFLQIYDLCGELAGACVITAYTLIYTSLLIIWGGLQRADANTSPLLGPAGEEPSVVSTPPILSLPVVLGLNWETLHLWQRPQSSPAQCRQMSLTFIPSVGSKSRLYGNMKLRPLDT